MGNSLRYIFGVLKHLVSLHSSIQEALLSQLLQIRPLLQIILSLSHVLNLTQKGIFETDGEHILISRLLLLPLYFHSDLFLGSSLLLILLFLYQLLLHLMVQAVDKLLHEFWMLFLKGKDRDVKITLTVSGYFLSS